MPQEITIDGEHPKTKKQIKEAFEEGRTIALVPVSIFPEKEHSGDIRDAPEGHYTFVYPTPYDRRGFGSIDVTEKDGEKKIKIK